MSTIDSSRVFEMSELPAADSPTESDLTLVSRSGRSAPLALGALYAWIKGKLADTYLKLPSGIAPADALADANLTYLSQSGSQRSLSLLNLYNWLTDKRNVTYPVLPTLSSLSGKGGQVLMVAPNSGSLMLSGVTSIAGATLATGSGAGNSSATKSITGNARCGQITVTMAGGSSAANAVIVTVTFATPMPAAPRVFITPASAKAALLAPSAWVSETTVNGFVISTSFAGTSSTSAASALLSTGGAYIWNYLIEV